MQIALGRTLVRAGEGTIHEVLGRPDWVAKVFHSHLDDLAERRDKIAAMIESRPPAAVQPDGFVVLAWPLLLIDGDPQSVGYIMPRIDTTDAVEIHAVSNPSNRSNPLLSTPQWIQHATWHHLVDVAANLCLAVQAVHQTQAVIGDFQERNILVSSTTRVSLVDCDSMQFTDAAGRQFLCGVGRPEFSAP
jgi:DNA-binding helix-hairpin-helix protein with protein kinase domain